MATHLQMSEFDFDGLDSAYESALEGYLTIKLRDLFPDTQLPCNIYYPAVRKTDRAVRIAELVGKGRIYEHSFHEFLLNEDIEEIYIRKEDEGVYHDYFISHMQKALKSSDVPTEKKTELLYDNAETIVKKAFRERPSRANIALGEQLIDNFSAHLSADTVSSDALLSLFSKDYHTFSHCVQVALLGMAFCRFLRWKPDEVTDFGLGALFHDVGKNVIPDEILNKPSKLDVAEFEMIKKHPLLGYQQIKDTQSMTRDQLTVVLHHHEARDGSGYPYSLKGDNIHRYARVARIVDVFDALTTKRAYKGALPRAEALRIMNDEMRHTFDPVIFDEFSAFLQEEERSDRDHQGHRINIEMGTEALIRIEESSTRMKAILAGMEQEKYVVFRIQGPVEAVEPQSAGARVSVGYSHAGSVYGFKSQVLAFVARPFPLLVLACPRKVERVEHRKARRIDCHFRADARIGKELFNGTIADIGVGGCRFVIMLSTAENVGGFRLDEEVTIYTDFSGKLQEEQLFGKVRNMRFDREACVLGIHFTDMSKSAGECVKSLIRAQSSSRG